MIRIYKHDKPVELPADWDKACHRGVRITGSQSIDITADDNEIRFDIAPLYQDFSAYYRNWLTAKQNAMLYGGEGEGYSFKQGFIKLIQTSMGGNPVLYVQDTMPMEDGSLYIIGSKTVGVASIDNKIAIGVPDIIQANERIAAIMQDCDKCCWVIYHYLNELAYRCFKHEPTSRIFGLLTAYQAMCARWNLLVWSKASRIEIVNNKSSLSVLVGCTCIACDQPAQDVHIHFSTDAALEPEADDKRDTIIDNELDGDSESDIEIEEDPYDDEASKVLAMSGELVPYVAPISTNISDDRAEAVFLITKRGEGCDSTSTGFGDDRVYEYVVADDAYVAYNNWTSIDVVLTMPEMHQGERFAYLVQLIRGGRSMTGRVLASEENGVTIPISVSVTGLDREVAEDHQLLGYVTPAQRESINISEDEGTEEEGSY